MIIPGGYDITIYQGATYRQSFVWKDENSTPIDLTGYSARMMARRDWTTEPFISLTTDLNGGITLGDTDGAIELYMSADDTEELAETEIGVYDLELIAPNNGDVIRLLQGNILLKREVTHD